MLETARETHESAQRKTKSATKSPTKRRTKLTSHIHRVRLKNLKRLIEKRFAGNATHFAKAIDRTHTFIWQLQNEYRAIGEDTARTIEEYLALPPNSMDNEDTCKRSERLIAQLDNGHTQEYRMAPKRDLDDMSAPPTEWHLFPAHSASKDCFCFSITTEAQAGMHPGDLAFADPADVVRENGRYYVVMVESRWGKRHAGVLKAAKLNGNRWAFESQPRIALPPKIRETLTERYQQNQVRVIARVISIVRHL